MARFAADMYMTGDVDLPLELIEAHTKGELVIFVGAGASRNDPSNLPLFDDLAEIVGKLGHLKRQKRETVDHFLGRISVDIDVHDQVKRIIGRPDSLPNPNHNAIVSLARSSPQSRIITTNFDEHLEAAATAAGFSLGTKYLATALPVGRDFQGIAHIHGAVSQPASELILTDRDFGRAYLTDAWATRYLQQIFDNFVVLFIGYSHTDPIVSYLGLGLPSNAKRRFVLTHEPDEDRWDYLGIEAIGYSPEHDHTALSDVLIAWAKRASMGRLEHRALVARIAQGAPPATPVERDYLIDAVQNSDEAATTFSENATSADWLEWVENLDAFKSLFNPAADPHPGSFSLARWFATVFVANPNLQTHAFLTIARLGLSVTQQLFASLSIGVNQLAKADEEAARRWLILLATSIPGHSAPQSTSFLFRDPATLAERVVLEQMLRPRLALQRNVMLQALGDTSPSFRVELAWDVDHGTATEYWKALRNSADFDFAHYMPIFERALELCYELLSTFNGAGFDGISFRRSAIEPHPQDQFPEIHDLIIDVLRDGGEARYARDPTLAQRWLDTGNLLFCRLAVHLVASGQTSDSDKVSWILDRQLLWDFGAKHEVFMLLKCATPGASANVRQRLFAAVVEGRNDPDHDGEAPSKTDESPTPEHPSSDSAANLEQYETYNLLAWIADSDPTWTEVSTLRDALAAENSWGPRDYPDLHSWSSSGAWKSQPPFSREQFDAYIEAEGIDGALTRLLAFEYQRFMDGPEWSDALNLVRLAITDDPQIGIQMWDSPVLASAEDEKRASIVDSILQAWASIPLDEGLLRDAIARVDGRASESKSAWSIARFLSEQVRLKIDSIAEESLTELRAIAAKVWDLHAASAEVRDEATTVDLSLNAWPGMIGRFWVFEISARWQSHRDSWKGLDRAERVALDQVLSRECEGASQAGIPSITRETVFLFNADPTYTTEAIIPLFGGTSVPLNWSWGSYLHHPSWNDGLLEGGLYDKLLEFTGRIDELDNERGMRRQVVGLIVNIAAFSSLSLYQRLDLVNELVIQRPDLAEEAVREVIRIFIVGKPENYGSIWSDWLAAWMAQRLSGVPRIASAEELSAWADLAPFIADHAHDALELLDGNPAPFGQHFQYPEDLAALRPIVPEYVGHLADRMRATGIADSIMAYHVKALIDSLSTLFGREAVAPLLPFAASFGIEA